jgi:probable HAF family extracellular repeat protein
MMKYSVMDLGSLGGGGTAALDINDLGQVVGESYTANDQRHAFRTAPNSPLNPATDDLGSILGKDCVATGINNVVK